MTDDALKKLLNDYVTNNPTFKAYKLAGKVFKEHPELGLSKGQLFSKFQWILTGSLMYAKKEAPKEQPKDTPKEQPKTQEVVFPSGEKIEVKKPTNVPEQYVLKDLKAPAHGKQILDHEILPGTWFNLGLVADTHMACKEERLAELHATYDLFEREGIKTVLHAGNIVDGFIPKINQSSVITPTPDGQAEYVALNYPKKDNMVTHFITGDDHEGWWIKAGWNWGAYLEDVCRRHGRTDLKYVGHVEADIALKVAGAKRTPIVKVQHPGGGSAYARSYTGQKQVEAFEGGEKPDILIQGHYHVSNFMMDRGVYVVSLPGFQDQTIFARKKRLRMEVGGAILQVLVSPDGSISRVRIEWIRYFNRGFYRAYLPSDELHLGGNKVELTA